MVQRLYVYWVYGGMLAGVLLFALTPLLVGRWPVVFISLFLLLPMYMLHQYEEHDNDRFRKFVNTRIGSGQEILSSAVVFLINVPGVWGVLAIALYLAYDVHVGFGLIVVYLVLVNGVVHIAEGVFSRAYNPGLISAIILFIPGGSYTLWQIQQAGGGTLVFQTIGLSVALVIHAAIILYVVWRRNRWL